jgi:hypothetical protein
VCLRLSFGSGGALGTTTLVSCVQLNNVNPDLRPSQQASGEMQLERHCVNLSQVIGKSALRVGFATRAKQGRCNGMHFIGNRNELRG